MQTRRNHQGRFLTIWTGELPETTIPPHNRAEGACGGAPKRCYGKLARLSLMIYVEKAAAKISPAAAFLA